MGLENRLLHIMGLMSTVWFTLVWALILAYSMIYQMKIWTCSFPTKRVSHSWKNKLCFFSPLSSSFSVAILLPAALHDLMGRQTSRVTVRSVGPKQGHSDPNLQGMSGSLVCLPVVSERLQGLDYSPFTQCLQSSDVQTHILGRCPSFSFSLVLCFITPTIHATWIYCFICLKDIGCPCACLGSLCVLWLPPMVQAYADWGKVNWSL